MQNTNMKSLMIISFSRLSTDPRVRRQIQFLRDDYSVVAVGYDDPGIDGVTFVDCNYRPKSIVEKAISSIYLLLGMYERYYWKQNHIKHCKDLLSKYKIDLIIANEIDSLPLVLSFCGNTKLIFDAHEFSPNEFDESFVWRVFYKNYKKYLCKKYIKKVDAMITVCQGIADEYEKNYGVKPVVMTNAPDFVEMNSITVNQDKIRLVHHGAAIKSRKIENMIKVMNYLDDRFELDLFLVPSDLKYYKKLLSMVKKYPKVRILPYVNLEHIIETISDYDIGIYILEPSNFNNEHALPNKFFEFIQARLAIAVAPSYEMRKIVTESECGVVAENFEPKSMAECLGCLTKDRVLYYKKQSDKIARIMTSQKNKEKFLDLIKQI